MFILGLLSRQRPQLRAQRYCRYAPDETEFTLDMGYLTAGSVLSFDWTTRREMYGAAFASTSLGYAKSCYGHHLELCRFDVPFQIIHCWLDI